jgi:hypothetical protein
LLLGQLLEKAGLLAAHALGPGVIGVNEMLKAGRSHGSQSCPKVLAFAARLGMPEIPTAA